MELRDLQYFEAIAQHGHVGRAAEALHRTQPALTKAIQRLEATLGTQVFERHSAGVRLTPAGEALRVQAARVRLAVEDTIRQARGFSAGTAGHLRVGAAPTMAQYLLPGLCRELLQGADGLTLDARIGTSRRLRELLLAGEIDVLLGPVTPAHPELCAVPVVEDHVVIVAARKHVLFSKTRLRLADVLPYPWVLPFASDATEERDWLDGVFRTRRLELPRVQIETDSVTLLPRLIAETQGLSFITRRNLKPGRIGAALREVRIPGTTLTRSFGVLYRRDQPVAPAMQRLLDLVQQAGPALLSM